MPCRCACPINCSATIWVLAGIAIYFAGTLFGFYVCRILSPVGGKPR